MENLQDIQKSNDLQTRMGRKRRDRKSNARQPKGREGQWPRIAELFTHSHVPPARARPSLPLCREGSGRRGDGWIDVDQCMVSLFSLVTLTWGRAISVGMTRSISQVDGQIRLYHFDRGAMMTSFQWSD